MYRKKHSGIFYVSSHFGAFSVDQTPTPTRFLPKTAEDGGDIFGVLPETNPFEQVNFKIYCIII